jgi:hypothetical protein
MKIEVSNSEIFDKITILCIKQQNGLDIQKELDILTQTVSHIVDTYPYLDKLVAVLKTLNEQMWDIENEKRKYEENKNFNSDFIFLSRLVYKLNDERARIKKTIDVMTDSSIFEVKSHKSV